ncbi:MAG: TVP38/TMEM64 family protein [Clostridia bacterium]|nr:TVP38/TMEM64 family protein [Clostridia bacterium]
MRSKESLIKTIVIISFIVLLAASAVFVLYGWIGGHFESFESFRAYVESYGMWGPMVLTLIQTLQVILPVLPGFLGCIVGAALFGSVGGFLINYIGISAGSIIAYFLARRYGVRLVDKMVSMKKYEKYIEKINQSKSYTVLLFLSILLPLAPDDFLCYFSGLIDMKPKKFVVIILAAKPWCILFYSIFFAYLI